MKKIALLTIMTLMVSLVFTSCNKQKDEQVTPTPTMTFEQTFNSLPVTPTPVDINFIQNYTNFTLIQGNLNVVTFNGDTLFNLENNTIIVSGTGDYLLIKSLDRVTLFIGNKDVSMPQKYAQEMRLNLPKYIYFKFSSNYGGTLDITYQRYNILNEKWETE
jgi:hypothetical protein